MGGLGDGAVQAGVGGLEALEVGAGPADVQVAADALEIDAGGDPGGERGDRRLDAASRTCMISAGLVSAGASPAGRWAMSVRKVPRPTCRMTSPSASSVSRARRIAPRGAARRSTSARSVGSFAPGPRVPSAAPSSSSARSDCSTVNTTRHRMQTNQHQYFPHSTGDSRVARTVPLANIGTEWFRLVHRMQSGEVHDRSRAADRCGRGTRRRRRRPGRDRRCCPPGTDTLDLVERVGRAGARSPRPPPAAPRRSGSTRCG